MRHVAIISIIGLSIMASGCHAVRPPDAPSRLSVDTAETLEFEQAQDFARTVASIKKSQKKQPAPIGLKAALKPKKSEKVTDPAWKSIQQQKKKSEKDFTLIELIDLALTNNPQTRQSWEQTRVAGAVERQAESAVYPQVTISQTVTMGKQISSLALSGPGKLYDRNYGPSAQLTYLLLDFGGRSGRIEATFQKVLEANSQYNQSLQDLIRDVQKAYYTYYSAISEVEAEELDVKNTKIDYDAAQAKFDVGIVPLLDVLQAKSDYENSLYNLETAKGDLKTAKANLAQVIGVAADTNFDIVMPDKELPTGINEDNVSRLIDEAIQKRPDISALRAELKSKKASSAAAFSDVLPNLNFGLNAQQTKYKYYMPADFKANQNNYSANLSVNWDIFDGFNNWNKKKQADYEANIAMDNLIQAELEASSDVWVKYYDFNTAVQKLKFGQSYLETTQNSYDLALESYNAGLKSILDLTQAQSNLSLARSRLIQAKRDVFISLAELAHSTGNPNIKIDLAKE